MSILITGAGGFLAGHLAAELKRRGKKPLRFTGRIDEKSIPGILKRAAPRVIYHLAGTTKPLPWEGLWDAHVRVTRDLLDAVMRMPRREKVTVVICGSAAEYGAGRPGPVTESSAPQPISEYGATKLSQTILALSYVHAGLDVRVARVFNAIGPGIPQRLALGAFTQQLAEIERGRQKPRLRAGDLRPQRDFIDARDVASALIAVARKGSAGQIYNVCSGRPVSVSEMLRRLIALSGLEVKVQESAARKSGGVPRSYGSRRKLTRASGWKPRLSLDESLRDTLQWYRRA